MKILKTLFLALILTMNFACGDDDTGTPLPEGDLLIRVKNTSIYNFDNVMIQTSGDIKSYGNLSPNDVSEYQAHDMAYSYSFVELKIEGDTFTIQPIDFVGEIPLEDGKYTYEISANDSSDRWGRLNMITVED